MNTAIVHIDCATDSIPEVAEALAALDGVSEVYSVAGGVDLIAIVRVPRFDDIAEVIAGRISKTPGVINSETFVAFRAYSKHDLEDAFAIGLPTPTEHIGPAGPDPALGGDLTTAASLRWILTDDFGDDGPSRPLGECAEVDGLFVDLPEPPLERFTLIGVAPAPALHEAVARRDHFDDVCLEPMTGDVTTDYLGLSDVTLVAVDGDRLELTGRVDVQRHLRPDDEPPKADSFRMTRADVVIARFRAVEGFFRDRAELLPPPVTLRGFRPSPGFVAALDAWRRDGSEDLELSATITARYADGPEFGILEPGVFSTVRSVEPSALGPDLLDVHLEDGVWEPLPAGARPLWESWLRQRPTEVGTWVPLSPHMRHEWLRLALSDHRRPPDRPAGSTYHLDGTHVTDGNAFYCALGEAVNGPGGYFGWNGFALNDCLRGEWGPLPFTVVWTAHETARDSMGAASFTELMEVFAQANVTVTLA